MTGTVMFDLQAAVMAAAVNGKQTPIPDTGEIPEGDASFSDILAAHTEGVADQQMTDMTVSDGAEVSENGESAAIDASGLFCEALKKIENADDGIKKALELLLKTVVNAMKGSNDGKERKTDLFMILSDGGADMFDSEDGDDLLLGAEIMDQLGAMLETDTEILAKTDNIFAGLEKFVAEVLNDKDDEADEKTAAELLAAMLGVQPEEIESVTSAPDDVRSRAVENAAEALRAPMQAIEEKMPEKVPEAEKLYSEFSAEASKDGGSIPETSVRVNFAAFKISNATEQVNDIGVRELADNTETPELQTQSAEENAGTPDKVPLNGTDSAAAAAAGAPTEVFVVNGEIGSDDIKLDPPTAVSVENQVRETIEYEISDIGDKDGTKELVLILKPKDLGQVAVKLVKENGTVSVMLSAQYNEVGKLMTERAAYLGNSLSNQDYVVKDVQIVEPGNAAEQMGLNFTGHGFSFASNSGQEQGYQGGNGGYDGTDGAAGIEETEIGQSEIKFREAKLWTTA